MYGRYITSTNNNGERMARVPKVARKSNYNGTCTFY